MTTAALICVAASAVFIIAMAIFAVASEWADDRIEAACDDLNDHMDDQP